MIQLNLDRFAAHEEYKFFSLPVVFFSMHADRGQ